MPIHRLAPAAATIALLGTVLVPPSMARAASPAAGSRAVSTTTCRGTQTVAYSPGLTATAHKVTAHGTSTLARCVSTSAPGITAGRSTFTATGRFSCTAGTYEGTRKISWNNGRTSTLSFTSGVSLSGGQSLATIKGTVTGGEFSGQKWSATFVMFGAKPDACATREGLATASGPLLLTIGSRTSKPALAERSTPTWH